MIFHNMSNQYIIHSRKVCCIDLNINLRKVTENDPGAVLQSSTPQINHNTLCFVDCLEKVPCTLSGH